MEIAGNLGVRDKRGVAPVGTECCIYASYWGTDQVLAKRVHLIMHMSLPFASWAAAFIFLTLTKSASVFALT